MSRWQPKPPLSDLLRLGVLTGERFIEFVPCSACRTWLRVGDDIRASGEPCSECGAEVVFEGHGMPVDNASSVRREWAREDLPEVPYEEDQIVWLEDPRQFDYVREAICHAPDRRRRPRWRGKGRLVGYATLTHRTPRDNAITRWFWRRVFTICDHDRSELPNGVYAREVPAEAVDPLTVAPNVGSPRLITLAADMRVIRNQDGSWEPPEGVVIDDSQPGRPPTWCLLDIPPLAEREEQAATSGYLISQQTEEAERSLWIERQLQDRGYAVVIIPERHFGMLEAVSAAPAPLDEAGRARAHSIGERSLTSARHRGVIDRGVCDVESHRLRFSPIWLGEADVVAAKIVRLYRNRIRIAGGAAER